MQGKGSSRRGFLKGLGASVTVGTLAGPSDAIAMQGGEPASALVLPQVHHHPLVELDIAGSRDSEKWKAVPDGIHGSFASKDETYPRDEVPDIGRSIERKLVAWRGERVTALIVLHTRTGAEQVRFEAGPLKSSKGVEIPADKITARFVRYVLTNLPFDSSEGNCDPEDMTKASLMPDVLDTADRFDMSAESTRPVWISIDVPVDASAGLYRSEIKILAAGGHRLDFTLEVEVQAETLPAPKDWEFQLDLWQNPWAVAFYHGVEPWSSAHVEILKPHLRMLAEAGQKFITTYLVHSPWKDDTYVADSTMVEWILNPDGSWTFDYTIFDRYIKLAMECGITQAITCYTPLPWKHRVRYLDAKSGDYIWKEWAPTSPEFQAFWAVFLKDLRHHLVQRGWFERTYIGINENPMEDTRAAIQAVKRDSSDWKLTYAGNWHPELSDSLDDYCVIIDQPPSPDQLSARKAAGKTTTFYVCCYPGKPNNYPFSPSAEGVWMGWHAANMGYDGFLRWAYDSWTADPLRDTRHVFWPAGDCFMVYPGCRSSIRFERLREGIVDFEKIRILKKQAVARGDEEKIAALDRILGRFTYAEVNNASAAEPVNAGKTLLTP